MGLRGILAAADHTAAATPMPMPQPHRHRRGPEPDRRRALESIYALVIASLMIAAVALALMAGRVLAAESQWNLKPQHVPQ